MAQLLAAPYSQFVDSNGAPLNAGKIYTYTAGSGYVTPKATYTDSAGGTPLANPVVLDSAGRAAIWLDGSYGIVVKDSAGNTISSTDNITAIGTLTSYALTLLDDSTAAAARTTLAVPIELIETKTASTTANFDFTTGISSTYYKYVIVLSNMRPATDDVYPYLQLGTIAGGIRSTSGDYSHRAETIDCSGTTVSATDSASATLMQMTKSTSSLGVGNASGESVSGEIHISNPTSGNATSILCSWTLNFINAGGSPSTAHGCGSLTGGSGIICDRFNLAFSSGNITSGKATLYGYRA